MTNVAYGFPERSVSEADLLRCLELVTVNFDEFPDRMHAFVGPPGRGVRWLSFASSSFNAHASLAAPSLQPVPAATRPSAEPDSAARTGVVVNPGERAVR